MVGGDPPGDAGGGGGVSLPSPLELDLPRIADGDFSIFFSVFILVTYRVEELLGVLFESLGDA